MSPKKYGLYWKEVKIGNLTETNWDMRSFGHIVYLAEFQTNAHLSDFVKSSINASNYLNEGDEENYSYFTTTTK